MTPSFSARHHLIEEAAAKLVAVADNSGESLVAVIATKVGDAVMRPVRPDRRGYTLHDGRLVEVA